MFVFSSVTMETAVVPSYMLRIAPSSAQLLMSASLLSGLIATNEYGQYNTGNYPFFADYPGSQLIEPYKNTSIEVTGAYSEDASVQYLWVIDGQSSMYVGNPISLTINTTGLFGISVHAYDSSDNYLASYSSTLISK